MRFSPQRRALFRHLNFQKWSGAGVFCTFWLRNVLRTTTACNFSSLIWPDGFFTRRFSLASLLFDPLEPQILGKTQCFATFLPFRTPGSSFFWLFLFSDLLSSTLLFSLTLPSRLLLFICPFVGSLISKLPSIIVLLKSHSVQGMDYTSIAGPDVRDSQALDWWKAQANCRGRNYWTKQLKISVADSLRTWEMVDKVLDIHSVADAKGMRGALSGQPNAKNG